MELTAQNHELIARARALVDEREVSGGIIEEVGSALMTKGGLVFEGISLADLLDIDIISQPSEAYICPIG